MDSPTQVFTFQFPTPKVEHALYTDPAVIAEWLATLIGETLIDIPGSYGGTALLTDNDQLGTLFLNTISPLDTDRIPGILDELETCYDQAWEDQIFKSYNFSNEGFYSYEYRIQPNHFTIIGYASSDIDAFGGSE